MIGRSGIGTILCVDDDVEALNLRKAMIEMHGYKVLTATNGEQALKLFEAEEIDVVLTDHLLRGRTGTALAAEMKRHKPDVPIAIYSGVSQIPTDIEKADVFITKLVTPEELLAYLHTTISARKAQGRVA